MYKHGLQDPQKYTSQSDKFYAKHPFWPVLHTTDKQDTWHMINQIETIPFITITIQKDIHKGYDP